MSTQSFCAPLLVFSHSNCRLLHFDFTSPSKPGFLFFFVFFPSCTPDSLSDMLSVPSRTFSQFFQFDQICNHTITNLNQSRGLSSITLNVTCFHCVFCSGMCNVVMAQLLFIIVNVFSASEEWFRLKCMSNCKRFNNFIFTSFLLAYNGKHLLKCESSCLKSQCINLQSGGAEKNVSGKSTNARSSGGHGN